MLKPLLEYIIKELVEKPEEVSIEIFHDVQRIVIEINAAQDDIKRVIGKSGQIIKTLRSLVYVLSPGDKEIVIDLKQ